MNGGHKDRPDQQPPTSRKIRTMRTITAAPAINLRRM
jgi:hypothetical protein